MKSLIKKSIALSLLIVSVYNSAIGQSDDDDKNFRFGIKVNPMLTWFRPDADKSVQKDGVKAKFGYALMAEFKLAKVISFATGVGGDYEGGKLIFKDSASYYVHDGAFISVSDTAGKSVGRYLLKSRSYNINYITIPVTLKMKTKDIGGLTYYAIFGGDIGIRTKSIVTDEVGPFSATQPPAGFTYDPTNIDNTKDMNILRTALNVGGGFEYNLAGSTSLVVGINYRRGFMPVIKKNSEYLLEGNTSNSFKSTVLGDALLLTVGVLF